MKLSRNALAVSPDANGIYTGCATYDALGGGISGICLLSAGETGGAFSLFLVTMQPGAAVLPHIHQNEDEGYCVLDGQLTIQLGDSYRTIVPGGSAWVPRGTAHGLQNTSDTTTRVLIVATPGGFENFFAELNTFGGLLPGEAEADRIGRMIALLGRYGMTPVAPASLAGDIPVIGAGVGDELALDDHGITVRVRSEQTSGAFFWMSAESHQNAGVPPHIHALEDETFYIVSGKFAIALGENVFEAGPGDVVFAPRGIVHAWQCISPGGGRAECISTPGANFEAFFRTMAGMKFDPARDMANPERMAQFMALTAAHQIEMLPPIK